MFIHFPNECVQRANDISIPQNIVNKLFQPCFTAKPTEQPWG